ncbi:alpha/beta hydrolase [Streptomyces sp. TRM66268-LWL]|uniref:Alpha/beta hydrolase n=1 Tax=Streptomyces polyasparticus TaxID=2767826 RepID=A0ABR7SLT2_9ACTN|nr:alpha/beta hydrolase [Streptomyces polyasparticus]MBC9716388.1 alpha/beta hydrolase [Streptomyces polyasparticus]
MVWGERVVVRDGVRLVCRDWGGDGVPLVLLHGLAGHAGEWDEAARALRDLYRVVALDQRGHGASSRLPGDVSRAAYVADVVAVVRELGLERPVLVGQSLGGHTALLTAAAHPDLARGLVLVEAAPGDASPRTPEEIGAWLDAWPVPFASREDARAYFGGGPAGEGWAAGLEDTGDGLRPRFDRDVMVASLAEIGERSFRAQWPQVGCPALVVLGERSFVPAADVDAMLAARPRTWAASVPGAGHDLHLERPDALLGVVGPFLEGLD